MVSPLTWSRKIIRDLRIWQDRTASADRLAASSRFDIPSDLAMEVESPRVREIATTSWPRLAYSAMVPPQPAWGSSTCPPTTTILSFGCELVGWTDAAWTSGNPAPAAASQDRRVN